ncbi:GNAT family N-acetyltransferase [Natrarchaeobaculum sulfurireducens]|nr:GNAT family N-acetyltransferase [Natrarchaeobaculum sulfurireducens]
MQLNTDSADGVRIRTATPDDGESIGTLFTNSPDGGAVSFAPQFEYDPYEVYVGLRPETTGFVAETDDGRLAGVGFVSNTEARFDGEIRPSALLNALAVHPDFRGRGLAKRIVEHRITHAQGQLGEDCVVFANIQHGNDPSKAVATWWADSLATEFVMYPPMEILLTDQTTFAKIILRATRTSYSFLA